MVSDTDSAASAYKHTKEAVQRPDVGVEAQFSNKKSPKTYRYDSSLAPELAWDESAERAFAEWLLALVADAAERGERERGVRDAASNPGESELCKARPRPSSCCLLC